MKRLNWTLVVFLMINPVFWAGNHATKQTGARNRLWPRGITGDPNAAIAVLDTGIDAQHAAFAPGFLGNGRFDGKIVYWYDAHGSDDGLPDDSDTSLGSGHGTHAAGLAAGAGFAAVDAQGRLVNTNAYPTQLSGDYVEQTAMHVNKLGTISIRYTFDSNKGDIEWAKLMVGNREFVNQLSDGPRELLSDLETVVTKTDLVGTPGLAGIDADEADQFNWNIIEYEITSPDQFGTYHFVTRRNVYGSGLGADLRFIYVAAHPALVNSDGTDPEDNLPYYMGQAPDTKLLIVQATSSSDFYDAIDAMYDQLAAHHTCVVNLSAASSSFRESDFERFERDGMVMVAAVGNSSYNASIGKPARFPSVVAVGGLSAAETLAWYPNAGPEMDILAPGGSNMVGGGLIAPHNGEGNFPSAWGYDLVPNDGMGMQGSSMATPSAAGVFALVYDALGGWDDFLDNHTWTLDGKVFSRAEKARHVKRLVFMTATELNTKRDTYSTNWDPAAIDPVLNRGYDPNGDAAAFNYGKDKHEGYGRVNVDAAADAALLGLRPGDQEHFSLVSSRATWSSTVRNSYNLYSGTYHLEKARAAKAFARKLVVTQAELDNTYQDGVNLTLDVPTGADFDLFVYRPDFGPNGQPLLAARSINPGLGANEGVLFQPDVAGTWYVVIKAVSGEGPATLTVDGDPCDCNQNQSPTADFRWSANGMTVSFNNEAVDVDGTITAYEWDFGDGQTSTLADPSVTYAAAGNYQVSLTVTDNEGAVDSTVALVSVSETDNRPPVAAFDWQANLLTVSFSDTSYDTDGTITAWQWHFSDGQTSQASNPTVTFDAAGSYTVTLTVSDDQGASATTSQVVALAGGGDGELVNDVPLTVSGVDDSQTFFTIQVPAGQDWLTLISEAGSGDLDLYLAYDRTPSRSDFDFKSTGPSNAEDLAVIRPAAGTWHLLVFAYRDYNDATLTAAYGKTPLDGVLQNRVPLHGIGGVKGTELRYSLELPFGATNLELFLADGSGDLDLYVKQGAAPSRSDYDFRSAGNGNEETISVAGPDSGTWHVLVYAYRDSSGATLTATYDAPGDGDGGGDDGGGDGGGDDGGYTNTTPVVIPDGDDVGVDSRISVDRTGEAGTIRVRVNVTHSYVGDLVLTLRAPDGTTWVLHDREGGSSDDLALDLNLDATGVTASGTWTLNAADQITIFEGTFESWSISFL